jgi:hypothetical protein
MVNLGSIGDSAMSMFASWGTSIGFWMLIGAATALALWVGLVFRKRRKFTHNVLLMYDLGNGYFDFKLTTGGWFKSRFTLFNLWDYGPEKRFRTKDMVPIDDVSHNDYRRINGKNGIVAVVNPHDPKFIIPISKFYLHPESKRALAEIAPADLRDAACKAIDEVDLEMTSKWQKIMPYLALGFVGMILIFSILLIAQYGKSNIEKTTEIMKLAIQALKDMGSAAAAKYTTASP